jgi:hypothetical protein
MNFGMDVKAHDELRYSCTPHTQSKRASWIKANLLFLAEQNNNRLTLEARDDLGTLSWTPMSGNVRLGGKIGAQPSASVHPPTRH